MQSHMGYHELARMKGQPCHTAAWSDDRAGMLAAPFQPGGDGPLSTLSLALSGSVLVGEHSPQEDVDIWRI
jgi:hypothetical protein